jgi:hypothetical protein
MVGNSKVARDVPGPCASVLYIMGEALLPRIEIDGRNARRPDLIRAIAICIATVDFPDPPFSLPTTFTRAERARVAFSIGIRVPRESGRTIRLIRILH